MKPKIAIRIVSLMLVFSWHSAPAEAADDDEMDATMRLMDDAEAELPEAVTQSIQLPEHLRIGSVAAQKSEAGLQRANDARNNQNRENGLNNAFDALERANDIADAAHENRENHGRSGDVPATPNPGTPGGPPAEPPGGPPAEPPGGPPGG